MGRVTRNGDTHTLAVVEAFDLGQREMSAWVQEADVRVLHRNRP
jgi:hypothetical protein